MYLCWQHRLPWLVSCLFEHNFPQHSVTESMTLREGLGTGANPHCEVHQAWITNFCPGAEHSCQSCEGTAIPCLGPLPCLLLGSYLPPCHLARCILYALGTAGEVVFSASQAQSGVVLASPWSSCDTVTASLLALGCLIPITWPKRAFSSAWACQGFRRDLLALLHWCDLSLYLVPCVPGPELLAASGFRDKSFGPSRTVFLFVCFFNLLDSK